MLSTILSRSLRNPTLGYKTFSTKTATSSGGKRSNKLLTAGLAALGVGGIYYYTTALQQCNEPALDPKEFRDFQVRHIQELNHNTKVIRFDLKRHQVLNLPVASCLVTKAESEKGDVIRPYTPITSEKDKGFFELLVKRYENGAMSTHIHNLKVGDKLAMKGPILKYEYKPNMHKHIGMVAGGTGITPMFQVIEKILDNPDDKTKVSLVFGNIEEGDILLRDKFDSWAKQYPERFSVYYTLDKPTESWKGGKGYLTKEVLSKVLPAPSDSNMVFVCGPPGMMNSISGSKAPDYSQGELKGLLKEIGFTSKNVFKF